MKLKPLDNRKLPHTKKYELSGVIARKTTGDVTGKINNEVAAKVWLKCIRYWV